MSSGVDVTGRFVLELTRAEGCRWPDRVDAGDVSVFPQELTVVAAVVDGGLRFWAATVTGGKCLATGAVSQTTRKITYGSEEEMPGWAREQVRAAMGGLSLRLAR